MILMLVASRASRSGASAGLPSREKSPASRYGKGFAAISVISEFTGGATGAIVSAIGLARTAAVIAALSFMASSMGRSSGHRGLQQSLQATRSLSGLNHRGRRAGLAGRDRSGRLHLLHQVVVPFAFDLEVGAGAE